MFNIQQIGKKDASSSLFVEKLYLAIVRLMLQLKLLEEKYE